MKNKKTWYERREEIQAKKGTYFPLKLIYRTYQNTFMEIEVKGHSGCQIDVVNEDGGVYVYKSTADPKYL